jgi:hypothetical protein
MADAGDLKSSGVKSPCGFKSRPRHLFRKPPIFYIILFILGFIVGEFLSYSLPQVLPQSGALEVATHKFQFGLENLEIDLFFFLIKLGFKIKASILGVLVASIFAIIGRYL